MKVEISHDSLAKIVYGKASDDDKMLIKISNFIKKRHRYFKENRVLLKQEDLSYIRPHLKSVVLEKGERRFIWTSYFWVQTKRLFWVLGGLFTTFVLLILVLASLGFYLDLQDAETKLEEQLEELERKKAARTLAEHKADSLLKAGNINAADLSDTNLLRQLVIKYDTLAIQQKETERQRDIAQSATLSELAESALEQKDKRYAMRLVEKSLELNPENNQALKILADISDSDLDRFASAGLDKIIQETKQKISRVGQLKQEELEAIFSKENKVVQNRKGQNIQAVVQKAKKKVQQRPVKRPIVKPKLLKEFQQNKPQLVQQQSTTSPTPQSEGPTSPIQEQQKNVQTLPCGLISRLSDKWAQLAKKGSLKLFFRFTDKFTFALKIESTKRLDKVRASQVLVILKNNQKITLPILRAKAQKNQLLLSTKLSQKHHQLLRQQKVKKIILLSKDNAQRSWDLPPNSQSKLLRASECLF